MARQFTPKVVTANALLEGDAVYLTADDRWSRHHHEAELIEDEAEFAKQSASSPVLVQGAAKLALEIRPIATRNGGVCTMGNVTTRPGIVTAVVGECEALLDQRHMDADALARMWSEAHEAATRFAAEEKTEVVWEKIWSIEPIPFHPQLIEFCDAAIRETVGKVHRLPSGPLHDAAEVARTGVPTIMMFVQSLRGISHNKIEDTKEEHLRQSVAAFDRLASKAMTWIQSL